MLFAQAVTDPVATSIAGGGIAAVIIKWFMFDLRDQRKEREDKKIQMDSQKVREENLIEQTGLLKELIEQKRKCDKSSRKNHRKTRRLLKQVIAVNNNITIPKP